MTISISDENTGSRILFLQSNGSLTIEPIEEIIIPVIEVSIRRCDPEDPLREPPETEFSKVIALVDTGATGIYIDEDCAIRLGLIPHPTYRSTIQSATTTAEAAVYYAQIFLHNNNHQNIQATQMYPVPLRKNGRAYDLVLGMNLISNGKLIIDFRKNLYQLDIG